MLAAAYIHRLDPFAIQFTETFGLRWYGLSYAVGFLVAWLIALWFARTKRSPISVVAAGDLMYYIIGGVLIGGRVGYAVFYQPSLFGFSGDFPFWGLLAIWDGGMASHGGLIGVIVACSLFAARYRVPRLHLFDVAAVMCPPGLAFGRLANFVNGELWGRALPAVRQANPPWWSVKYPEEIALWRPPADVNKLDQLETLRATIGGDATFVASVIDAVRDGNAQVTAVIQPLLTAYYPSQLLQALAEGPVLFFSLALIWLRPRKPGVIGAWWLLIYGVLRVLTETVREPDIGVALTFGLSRGQTLSAVMILAGAVILFLCARRKVEPMGGLRRPLPVAAGERA